MELKFSVFKVIGIVLLVMKIAGGIFSWWFVIGAFLLWALETIILFVVRTYGLDGGIKSKLEAWALDRIFKNTVKEAKRRMKQ